MITEERRWQKEAAKVDGLEDQIKQWPGEHRATQELLEQERQSNQELRTLLKATLERHEELISQMRGLASE